MMTMASPISLKLPLTIKQPKINNTLFHLSLQRENSIITSSLPFLFHYNLTGICYARHQTMLPRACSDGGSAANATPQELSDSSSSSTFQEFAAFRSSTPGSEDAYVASLTQMLGIDNDLQDRQEAVIALSKYSQGGKHRIDRIMQFRGCISLTVSLLKSDSSSTCEAAACLLRNISSLNPYRDSVAEGGAIEEISRLLSQSSLTADVKEQILCVFKNLSVDEKLRMKIANTDLLPELIKALDDEEIKVKEAAGGVLENLALTHSYHQIMVESGVIPKLAKFLERDAEVSKVIRKEAKNALLELAKTECYRILIMEEGLVLVPIVGMEAYKSFKAVSRSWPSLPDGTEFEQSSSIPSRYGAAELLLGLSSHDKNFDLEEAKINAIVGRNQQQFLARIGAIEMEDGKKPPSEPLANLQNTLLPWIDGVARLVLILGLEDESAVSRAAWSIGEASINEHMRMSFKVAGAVKILVELLNHNNENVRLAASHALDRLSSR